MLCLPLNDWRRPSSVVVARFPYVISGTCGGMIRVSFDLLMDSLTFVPASQQAVVLSFSWMWTTLSVPSINIYSCLVDTNEQCTTWCLVRNQQRYVRTPSRAPRSFLETDTPTRFMLYSRNRAFQIRFFGLPKP